MLGSAVVVLVSTGVVVVATLVEVPSEPEVLPVPAASSVVDIEGLVPLCVPCPVMLCGPSEPHAINDSPRSGSKAFRIRASIAPSHLRLQPPKR